MDTPVEKFDGVTLECTVDLENFGGIQRFRTVADIATWMHQETAAWEWVTNIPMRQGLTDSAINRMSDFWAFQRDVEAARNESANRWRALKDSYQEAVDAIDKISSDPVTVEQHDILISTRKEKMEGEGQAFASRFSSFLRSAIVTERRHLSRFEPACSYLGNLAKSDARSAAYALEHLLAYAQGNDQRDRQEFDGKLAANMFHKGWKFEPNDFSSAFGEHVKVWSQELKIYKEFYAQDQKRFDESADMFKSRLEEWTSEVAAFRELASANLQNAETQAASSRESDQQELAALKDLYEKHMQLQGPMGYWSAKSRRHRAMVKLLSKWLAAGFIVGLAMIVLAAIELLPGNYPSDTIPWRPIGIFLIVSTFVIWFVKLGIRLLLSNIHLEADASERVVMINTFMALTKKLGESSSGEQIKLAEVLNPIFRPSTTGVISDDGGPVTAMDFFSKLAGK